MRPVLTDDEIAQSRADVCHAAEVLFARHGVDGVTMRQIAGELGWSSTTAYRYFRNKEEILAAVRAAAFNRFSEVIEQATLMQFMMHPLATPRDFEKHEPAFRDISAYLTQMEPPKYPFAIDKDKAAKGEVVFKQNCAKCTADCPRQSTSNGPSARASSSATSPAP